MSKTKISEFSTTPGDNTDINGINIAEGCAPSGINNAIRQMMADLKEWQSGAMDVYVVPAGTAAAPGIQFYGDLDTGIYRAGANQLGITVGGVSVGYFDSTGWIGNIAATTLDATNIEVTNVKAKDGTAAFSIADTTGNVTFTSVLNAATFNSTTVDTTNIEVTNIKAKDGTAAVVLTDSTGAVGVSTALTASAAVTFSATSANIALGTSQTTGTFTVGGAAQTGAITVDQSTKTHTINIASGATESAATKTVNVATGGLSGSTTTITIGSENGTSTTVNGATTLNASDGFALYVGNTTASTSGSSYLMFRNKDGAGNFRNVARVSGKTTDNGGNGEMLFEIYGSATPYKGLKIDNLTGVSMFDTSGNVKFYWDSVNSRLGLNKTDPATTLDVAGAVTANNAITFSATTQNIALGTSQTSGTWTAGGASQTGAITLDQSTKTHTLAIGAGATESGETKTINLGTAGVSGSTTTITIGSTNGTSTTLNGTVTAATLNSTTIDTTNIEVTNVKAKDGTAAIVLTDSTGAVTVSTALTANGGAVFNENGANVDFRVEGDTDANLIFADASADFVGIGTNAPGAKLDVAGNIRSTGGAVDSIYSGTSAGSQLGVFRTYGTGAGVTAETSIRGVMESGSTTSSYLEFLTTASGSLTSKMRLTSTGTLNIVGAGTAGTNQAVSINGSAPVNSLVIDANGNLQVGTISADVSKVNINVGGAAAGVRVSGVTGQNQDFYAVRNGSATIQSGPNITLQSASGTTYATTMQMGPTGETLFFNYNGSAWNERARITSGGDFYVGNTTTSSPGDGNTTAGTAIQSAGKAYFSAATSRALTLNRNEDGNVASFFRSGSEVGSISVTTTATAFNTSSDYRLKDNPQPLTNSGAFIDALKPKTWNWKVDGTKGVGFIAHEVQEVSPGSVVGTKDAVDEDGKPVMQAMEYGSAEFIANIIAELQSLRARVAELEASK